LKNTLSRETSPYLLQHAHNPVHWFSWCDEAFETARQLNRPVFLSIGYSTCHWCHVMARESFENQEAAELLNRYFISIKVDRETRPDIDTVYMNVCQDMTGSGGWPLSIFMTPDKKPFFAGTYFPLHARYGQPGFIELLTAIAGQWQTNQADLIHAGNQITTEIQNRQNNSKSSDPSGLTSDYARQAITALTQTFDRFYGGFGAAPKFPSPHILLFLLKYGQTKGSPAALAMAETTLNAMYRGGIYDHVGGGFSRYSTDQEWLVPHFEKMLYDNAMLVLAYSEAFRITGDPVYEYIIRTTLNYIREEMTSPEHGFYSAQDADSEGMEGKYYTWTPDEIAAVIGPEDLRYLSSRYGITATGNFEGKNIPNRLNDQQLTVPDEKTRLLLDRLKARRSERFQLHKDDKVLTAWNGMMAAAYARAGRILNCREYIMSAEKAVRYIEKNLTDDRGCLYISRSQNHSSGDGMLDDYAFLLLSYLELYDCTGTPSWLEKGIHTAGQIIALFSAPGGGLYMNAEHAETLLYRPVEYYDGAVPSGNSAAAYGFVRLAALTGLSEWEEAALKQLSAFSHGFKYNPSAHTFALTALLEYLSPHRQLVCIFNEESSYTRFKSAIGTIDTTGLAIHILTKNTAKNLIALLPELAGYWSADKKPQIYYLCRNQNCLPPFYDLDSVLAELERT